MVSSILLYNECAILTHSQEYMPLPPPSEEEPPKLQFSIVECLLFTFHQLGQKVGVAWWAWLGHMTIKLAYFHNVEEQDCRMATFVHSLIFCTPKMTE